MNFYMKRFLYLLFLFVLKLNFLICVPEDCFVLKTEKEEYELNLKKLNRVIENNDNNPNTTIYSIKLNEEIPILFFDRGSKKLLIVGQGFPGLKESGKYTANLFCDYDVVLFDYKWSNSFK